MYNGMNPNSRISLLLSSLANDDSSLGRIGTHLAKFFAVDKAFDVWMDLWKESSTQDPDVVALARRDEAPMKFDVVLRKSDPYSASALAHKAVKVVSYIYYDAVKIEPVAVANINRYVTTLVAPSEFTKKRFQGFGVTVPIEVIPLAVDSQFFHPRASPKKKEKFTFLYYGEHSHRKGTDLLLKAFCEEFGNQEDVELLLVVSNFNRPDLLPNPTEWVRNANVANVRIVMARPPNEELLEYIQSSDCFVGLTREDSFGMCGLESMACGLPVIAPLNSGYAQYVEDGINGRLVSGTRVEHDRWEWIPSVDEAKTAMREFYTMWKNDDVNLAGYSGNARATAVRLSWKELGQRFHDLLIHVTSNQ